MILQTLHHIAIWTSDLAKAKAFYVDALGFRVLRENPRPDRGDVKLDLAMGDMELEVFCAPGHPSRATYPEALGLRHIAFLVPDVAKAIQTLEAAGVATEPLRVDAYTGKRMTFFHDPDGIPWELHE